MVWVGIAGNHAHLLRQDHPFEPAVTQGELVVILTLATCVSTLPLKPTETTAADKADGAPEEVDAKEASADVMETEEGKEAEATDAPVADGNEEGTEKTVEEGKE